MVHVMSDINILDSDFASFTAFGVNVQLCMSGQIHIRSDEVLLMIFDSRKWSVALQHFELKK